jgi:hypothetical protein
MVDLSDPAVRERLAERAYYRSKLDQAAVASEHDGGDPAFYALSWESLDDETRRPFRAGVDETAEALTAAA